MLAMFTLLVQSVKLTFDDQHQASTEADVNSVCFAGIQLKMLDKFRFKPDGVVAEMSEDQQRLKFILRET